jgi:hypothetical protein
MISMSYVERAESTFALLQFFSKFRLNQESSGRPAAAVARRFHALLRPQEHQQHLDSFTRLHALEHGKLTGDLGPECGLDHSPPIHDLHVAT